MFPLLGDCLSWSSRCGRALDTLCQKEGERGGSSWPGHPSNSSTMLLTIRAYHAKRDRPKMAARTAQC